MEQILASIRKWMETSTPKQKIFVSLIAFSLLASGALFSISGNSSITKDPLGSTPFYFISAIIKLIVVLLLIVGASIVFRRWVQPIANGKNIRQMRLLESIRLSPRQALHMIQIGDQRMVIGATDQNISVIASLSGTPAAAAEEDFQPTTDFSSLIRSFGNGGLPAMSIVENSEGQHD